MMFVRIGGGSRPAPSGSRYGYGTIDPLEQVLAPGYFAHGTGLLRPGDLVYVGMCPRGPGERAAGEPRIALVMARADERNPACAGGSVRLVQDFGGPGDPAGALAAGPAPDASAPPAPSKRARGLPPGSKNRKPAASSATTANADAS